MRKIEAAADVTPVRQRTQYTCMATSLMMCLRAHDLDVDEELVNDVMGARAMQGASWEQMFAAAQHFGQRVTFICPATVRQLKEYTDRGIPIVIAWNPEGRPWGHASVVFDVDDDLNVHVADPNIPDPDETVRVLPKAEFYGKWYEKYNDYMVRRPACAIEPEITQDGKQRVASVRGQPRDMVMLDEWNPVGGRTALAQVVDKALKIVMKALKKFDPARTSGNRGMERHLTPKSKYQSKTREDSVWQRKDIVRAIQAIPHIQTHRPNAGYILTLPGKDSHREPTTDYFHITLHDAVEYQPYSSAVSIYWVGNDTENADRLVQRGFKKRGAGPLVLQDYGDDYYTDDEWLLERMKKRTGPVWWVQNLMGVGRKKGPFSSREEAVTVLEKWTHRKVRFKRGSYEGNPDGDRIYPGKEFDHGYDEPLAGGTDVMRQLQNRLREEQDREPRPESPRVGAERVAERYLKREMK